MEWLVVEVESEIRNSNFSSSMSKALFFSPSLSIHITINSIHWEPWKSRDHAAQKNPKQNNNNKTKQTTKKDYGEEFSVCLVIQCMVIVNFWYKWLRK